MAPFYGWGSTASRLEPLRGGSLLFTTKQFFSRTLVKEHARLNLFTAIFEEDFTFKGVS